MIYLKDYISKENVHFMTQTAKSDVLSELIECQKNNLKIHNYDLFRKSVLDREKILSTGIGNEVAVPHVKLAEIDDFFISVGIHKEGLDWESIDDKPVHLIFLIGGKEDQEFYLRLLSKLVLIIKNENIRKNLLECENADEVVSIFSSY